MQVAGALHRGPGGGVVAGVHQHGDRRRHHQREPSGLPGPLALPPGRPLCLRLRRTGTGLPAPRVGGGALPPQRPGRRHPGDDQQQDPERRPGQLPGFAPAESADALRQRHAEQHRTVQALRPAGLRRPAAHVQEGGDRAVFGGLGQVVPDQRRQAQEQAAEQGEAGPAEKGPDAGQQQEQRGDGDVGGDEPVVPDQQPGDEPEGQIEPVRAPGRRAAETEDDRDQQEQRGPGVDLRVTAAGDELVLDHPVGAEGEQCDGHGGEPGGVEAAGQLPHHQQEDRVEQEQRQPQRPDARSGERHQGRRQVRLDRAHVVLAVEVNGQFPALADVQRREPHRRLVGVGRRHPGGEQDGPVEHPGRAEQESGQCRLADPARTAVLPLDGALAGDVGLQLHGSMRTTQNPANRRNRQ